MNFEFFIAKRYLFGKKKVSFISTILAISIIGVFLGTMVLIITLSVMNGFEKEVTKRIIGTFANIKLKKYHHEIINNPDSLIRTISKYKDVVAASPLIEEKIGVSSKEVRDGIIVKGIDLEKEMNVTDIKKNIKFGTLTLDSLESSKGRYNPSIILGSYVADKLRVIVGDEVFVMSFRGELDMISGIVPKMKRMTVSAVYESGMYEYDANLSFISIKSAKDMFNMKGVNSIQIKVEDPEKADIIAEKIQDDIGYPYYCMDWKKQYRTLIKWMNTEKVIAFIIISMIIMVAIFNIISSLLMVIMEKTGEIGILTAMGAAPKKIMKIFVLSGLSVGIIGTVTGATTGLIICYIQYKFNLIKLPGDVYFINSVPVVIEFVDVIAVVAIANLLCFLFSLYPAYKASRLKPIDALRYL